MNKPFSRRQIPCAHVFTHICTCTFRRVGVLWIMEWFQMLDYLRGLWHTTSYSANYMYGMQFSIHAVWCFNTLRPKQNGRHFADDIFKCIFLNGNVWIQIKISMKFVPKGPINNIPALVQIMAWRRPGDKPLSELMMVSLTTHICVTRPQWVKYLTCGLSSSIRLIRNNGHVLPLNGMVSELVMN